MIYASFGIKLFFDRDMLLTEHGELVHYGNGTRGRFTLDATSNVYFYIYDEQVCKDNDDDNIVIRVTELSELPVYHGNNPKFSLWKDDYKRQELIDTSKACIYFYEDESKLRFFLHYIYKDKIYNREINNKILALLKFIWFSSNKFSLTNTEVIGQHVWSHVSNLDIESTIKSLLIIEGNKTFYGRDSESTHYGERLIIDTQDPFILTTLLNISEKLYPRSYSDNVTYMYGESDSKEYNIFNDSNLQNDISLHFLQSIIYDNIKEEDCKKCIKYIILRDRYLNLRPSPTLSIQCVKFDSELILTEKMDSLRNRFFEVYSIGKHIGGLFFLLEKAVNVPNEILLPVMKEYLLWNEDLVKNSGLRHLTIYWSAKEICREFNNRSNNKFNFKLDFSEFSESSMKIIGDDSSNEDDSILDFDWDAFEKL